MVAATLLLHRVLVVANILAITVPTDAIRTCLSLFLRVDKRLEALIKARVRLQHVHNVEPVVDSLADITHLKVVPLLVSCRVVVIS